MRIHVPVRTQRVNLATMDKITVQLTTVHAHLVLAATLVKAMANMLNVRLQVILATIVAKVNAYATMSHRHQQQLTSET